MSAPDQGRLRDELRRAADASSPPEIDVDAVVRASRVSRRRRRSAVAGGTAAVAALLGTAGLVAGLAGLAGGPATTTADAPIAASAPELAPTDGELTETGPTGSERADAGQESAVAPRDEPSPGDVALGRLDARNRCGAPVVPATDSSQSPLSVTVRPDGRVSAGSTGQATVTVTNTGDLAVDGVLRTAPSIAVADAEGIVVGLRPDAAALPASRTIGLGPGESVELRADIEAVHCLSGRAPSALAPGGYWLTASVVMDSGDPSQPPLVAVSPLVRLVVE